MGNWVVSWVIMGFWVVSWIMGFIGNGHGLSSES